MTGVATQAADAKFKPLFNGNHENLKGWEPTPGGKWEVKNGVIVGTSPKSERRHGILLTKKRFKDFVVKAKFQAVNHGDSGFYFRVDRVKSESQRPRLSRSRSMKPTKPAACTRPAAEAVVHQLTDRSGKKARLQKRRVVRPR